MNDVAPSTPNLVPINDCVLIKLEKQYDNFSTVEGKYDTRTHGVVIAVSTNSKNIISNTDLKAFNSKETFPASNKEKNNDNDILINKRVYFEEYKEGARIKKDSELYCFIKIEDIRGYEDV